MLVYITMAVALVLTSKPTCDIHVLVKVPEDALAPRSNTDLDCSVGRRAEGAPSVNEFGDLVTDIVCRNWCETARSAYCYASDKPEMLSASAYHVMCRADNAHPTCIEPPCHQAQKGNGCFDLIQAWYARYCEYPVCRHFEEFEGSTDEVDCFVRETDAPTRQPDTETATTSNSTTESSLYVTPAHKIGEKTVVAGGFAGAIMGSALMLCVNCQPQHLLAAAEMVEEVEDMLDDHVSSDRQRAQQVLDLIQKSAELEA